MYGNLQPYVIGVERVGNAALILFSDGTSALFPSAFLYANVRDAQVVLRTPNQGEPAKTNKPIQQAPNLLGEGARPAGADC